jgi:hypothetical protein
VSDDANERAARIVSRRFASSSEADRHDLEFWMQVPEPVSLWALSGSLWRSCDAARASQSGNRARLLFASEAEMKTLPTGRLALVMALVPAATLLAHHSLANYDTTTPVRLKGTVARVQPLNPHSFIFLDATGPDGQARRWAIEGPSVLQLTRQGVPRDFVKAGDVIEVCGYAPKEPIVWQIANPDAGAASIAGRLLNAELLVTADGKEHSWGDYGVHKCFAPGFTDHHPAR